MKPALLAAVLLASAAAQDTHIVLLGTGTPNPDPERSGPAVAVVSGTNVYIVDAGPGVVRRAAQAGIAMQQITRAFVTHLHSDHTAGLPDLILTPAVTGRLAPLEIYGPPGLGAMTAHVMKAWREDMRVRLHGLEPFAETERLGIEVLAFPVHSGEVLRRQGAEVGLQAPGQL